MRIDDWLLETAETGGRFYAWISDPSRIIIGYGRAPTEAGALRNAALHAKSRCPAESGLIDLLVGNA